MRGMGFFHGPYKELILISNYIISLSSKHLTNSDDLILYY